MPFYEYGCESCGESFTLLRTMRERDEAPECPKCGSRQTARKVSVFATAAGGGHAPRTASGGPCGGGFS